MSDAEQKSGERDDVMSKMLATEAAKYGVPPLRYVGNAVMLSEMTGLDRLKIPRWVRNDGLRAAKEIHNGKGKYTYGFDLKDVVDWNYNRGYLDGVKDAEKKADKVKGAAGGRVYTDPETGEKIAITGPEVEEAIKRTILAKADKAEEDALRAKISRENEAKIISYNADIKAVVSYVMRQTSAAHAAGEDGFTKMLVDRGVHPDEARREVRMRFKQMLGILDRANPFVDPLAAERAALSIEAEASGEEPADEHA